jgi:hypothetical protein
MSWGAKGATRQLKLYPEPEVKAKAEVSADTRVMTRPSTHRARFSRPEKLFTHFAPPLFARALTSRRPTPPHALDHPQAKASSGDFEKLQTVSAVQWNSFRDTEVKRLLRPGIADGALALAENMTKASAISVNLVPLSADETTVLGDGLRKAKKMSVIRLKCEARAGGPPARPSTRTLNPKTAPKPAALGDERVCKKLGLAIAAQVKTSKTLLELEIGADLGPAGMEPIGKAIAANQSLLRLSFADSAMGDSSFACVVDGLRANVNVKELDLSGCHLTDASGEAIGSIMRAHASRRAVSDWESNLRCYPGSAASKDLARAQTEGTVGPVGGLLTLNLSYNSLSTTSAKAMCAALKSDTRLRTISLKSNKIDEDGAARFGSAMREHPRLAAIELQGTRAADCDLGILRVVVGSEVTMDHPEELDKQIVKKDVFMDMDCPPSTPRSKARRDAEVAAAKAAKRASRPQSAKVSATAVGSAGWYEGRRGWSPASGVGAAKWEQIGDHAATAKLDILASPTREGPAAARPASARPIGGRQTKMSPWAKRPASTLRDRSNLKDADGSDEKALVGQLTRALNSLEGRVGNMSADELREQVAAAARAAQTAAKVAASPSGKSSKQMLAKVRADLRALEEIVKS